MSTQSTKKTAVTLSKAETSTAQTLGSAIASADVRTAAEQMRQAEILRGLYGNGDVAHFEAVKLAIRLEYVAKRHQATVARKSIAAARKWAAGEQAKASKARAEDFTTFANAINKRLSRLLMLAGVEQRSRPPRQTKGSEKGKAAAKRVQPATPGFANQHELAAFFVAALDTLAKVATKNAGIGANAQLNTALAAAKKAAADWAAKHPAKK